MNEYQYRRKIYEREEDRRNEWDFAVGLCGIWNVRLKKLPIKYGLDFALMRGDELRGFLEIKCRGNASTKYSNYLLSLHKMGQAKRLHELTGKPSILAVQFYECNLCAYLHEVRFTVGFGGRDDRKDWQDNEPVAMISMGDFGSPSGLDVIRA